MGNNSSKDSVRHASGRSGSQITGSGGSKRSIFSRVTGRHKEKEAKESPDASTIRTASSSLINVDAISKQAAPSVHTINYDTKSLRGRKMLIADIKGSQSKEHSSHSSRIPFKHSKRPAPAIEQTREAAKPTLPRTAASLWNLDLDLGNMEGIVDQVQMRQQSFLMTPPIMKSEPIDGFPFEAAVPEEANAWDAPDSWAVKRLPEGGFAPESEVAAETTVTKPKDTGPQYFMRIFRADSTFAVISAGLNTTAAELVAMMAKKSYLQDDVDTYQMIMRKRGLIRQLVGAERPLLMQKQLLEKAGYQQNDHLEDLGREDQGYLCRFTFVANKVLGYTSLEKDTGFSKMQKFNHIDLTGRNLVTIPIALYQKAAEVITLNVSRNLSLDVPKDFMQSCVNLREIKYTGNEAEYLPSSFSMAAKLTMVDFSNNRLEGLDDSDMHRLTGLISLKLSNNMLKSLPAYLGTYQALRSLNLASNALTEFPDFLGQLQSLVDLDISFNSISSLPTIGKLTNLERLFATNNKLSGAFPADFSDLVNLHSLDIRFNAISDIEVMSTLPRLEHLMVGHNSITSFEGTFTRLKLLFLDHNPMTRFDLISAVPSLSVLNLASAKLTQLADDMYAKMPSLTKLVLNKNHFVYLSPQIGRLLKLEHLSVAKNELGGLPAEIGLLQSLKYLDVRENNLSKLPPEIWYAKKLESLNVASNVLAEFPKPGLAPKDLPGEAAPMSRTPSVDPSTQSSASSESDELGRLEGFMLRRPSYVPGLAGIGSSPGSAAALRKASVVSAVSGSRNPSLTAKTSTDSGLGAGNRKDSTLSSRLAQTFAGNLRSLILAENRLDDEVFVELGLLTELRQLNLSYNQIVDVPSRTLRRWPNLSELYLSGNDLTSLPAEDFEDGPALRTLHLNNNKFQVLPAEIGKILKLQTLDVASNTLKYNVANWPYDWNWNYNPQLRYLNLSGNKRLEIQSSQAAIGRGETRDLTDFSSLVNLRILGLMDVTLKSSVPDESANRRVRTAGSLIGTSISYGMADTLGRSEHVSTFDLVIPTYQGHDDQSVFGMFDGQMLTSGGSKVARYLLEKFRFVFAEELEKMKTASGESPEDALRRTYLGLNKELATVINQAIDATENSNPKAVVVRGHSHGIPDIGEEDLVSGAVATVCYLHGLDLYVSNVGDAQALLISSEGGHRVITRKHDPAETEERRRIKQAGGFVSRQGKLNDVLEVSRAFGYVQLTPVVTAAPHITHIELKETDEMILLASRELWDYLTFDFAVDIARSERSDLMKAAQKLRDLAIAFGATSNIMVMMIGVSDLRKRERAKTRTHSMSMGPSGLPDDYFTTTRRAKRGREAVGDSKLARLDQEVDAPQGMVSLVFTDIKNSTMLWESHYDSMRSAIKLHNEVMRRQLRIIGGYEVKTEGDAFMVAFSTVTSAVLWCFAVQQQLLDVPWPQEILNSPHCRAVHDAEGNVIFRGLSVRMGIHYGRPVCEVDPVTKRMDYFGPMVNRAARIESVADGGQITVSKDFIEEIHALLEAHIESDRSGSTGSEETLADDILSLALRRELKSLSAQGFEVKDLGMRTLKGLENPEYIYSMYPHSLASRRAILEKESVEQTALVKSSPRNSKMTIATETVWDLWTVSLRLESLCSSLECAGTNGATMQKPEFGVLDRLRSEAGTVTDKFLANIVEQQIARIEVSLFVMILGIVQRLTSR